MTNLPVTVEPSGYRNAKRLQRGGTIVGMLLQMSNGRWGIYDTNERQITLETFQTPKKARDAFVKLEKDPSSDAGEG